MNNKMGYVFISYSTRDSQIVDEIVKSLIYNNITYWKAPERIPAGSNYAKEIPKGIRECEVFLLLLSNASQNSIWVEKELDMAVGMGKKIIPVRLDDTPLSDSFRFYLNNVQFIPLREGKNGTESLLISRIKEMINPEMVEKRMTIEERRQNDRLLRREERLNALRANKIPVRCEYCGGALTQITKGEYSCLDCGMINYDTYTKIKRILAEENGCTLYEISRRVGVSTETVSRILKEESN